MRRVYQVAAIVIFLLAIYVAVESRLHLNYYTEYGPGSGFFSFWCGVLMAFLAALWFFQVTFKPVEGAARDLIPARASAIQVLSVLVGLAIFALVAGYVGFLIAMFAFLLAMLLILGRRGMVFSLVLSLGMSLIMTYTFRNMLEVQLPVASIEFLQNLGL